MPGGSDVTVSEAHARCKQPSSTLAAASAENDSVELWVKDKKLAREDADGVDCTHLLRVCLSVCLSVRVLAISLH